ncbi:MAG: cache domain-containing protein [Lachnospiraceae bacterium]|nr:cache domain-containing protein [Lachnospiraceae bacterium]
MKKFIKENRQFLIFIASIIMLMGFLGAVFFVLYQSVQSNAIEARRNEVERVAEKVDDLLEESSNTLKMSAYQVEVMMESGAKQEELLRYLTETFNAYSRVIDSAYSDLYGVFARKFMDGSGWVPSSDYVPESRPWYLAARNGGEEIAVVSSYYDMATGANRMCVSKCLADQRSVIAMDIDLDRIRKIVKAFSVDNSTEGIMVLDEDFFVVAHSDRTQIGNEYAKEEGTLGRMIADRLASDSDSNWFKLNYSGTSYLVSTADINFGWKAVTVAEERALMKRTNILALEMVMALLVLIAAVFIVYMNFRKKRHESLRLNSQLQAVAGIYEGMYQIDLKEDTFQEIKVNDETRQILGEQRDKAQYCIRTVMDELTEGHFKKAVFEFIDFSTMDDRLAGKRSIMREFVSSKNERCSVRFVPVSRDSDGKLTIVIVLVEKYT